MSPPRILLIISACGVLAADRGGQQHRAKGEEDRPLPRPFADELLQQQLPRQQQQSDFSFFLPPAASAAGVAALRESPGGLSGAVNQARRRHPGDVDQRADADVDEDSVTWRRNLLGGLAVAGDLPAAGRHPLGASISAADRRESSGGESSTASGAGAGSTLHAAFQHLFRVVEYERVTSRSADAPCVFADQRKTLTALLLAIVFPSAAHFYYSYVVLGVVQLILSMLMYFPLFLACGWWWRPVQPVHRKPFSYGADEDALNDTLQKIRSRTTALVVAVAIALVLAVVLTAWQVAMIVRLSTGDMQPANGCPSKPL